MTRVESSHSVKNVTRVESSHHFFQRDSSRVTLSLVVSSTLSIVDLALLAEMTQCHLC